MRKTGLCLVGLAALWAGAVKADVTAGDLIAYCQQHSTTPAQRIACLENALHIAIPGEQSMSSSRPRARPESPAPYDRAAAAPDSGQQNPARTADRNEYYASPSLPRGIGAEQVPLTGQDRKQARAEYLVSDESRVVDFALNARGKLVLVLDNGQVWKQRGGDVQKVRMAEGESPRVRIRHGAVSGYRMDFLDKDRTITVSRVK